MRAQHPVVLYLHGFNSSPDSHKSRLFQAYCHDQKLACVCAPALSHDPAQAISALQALVNARRPVLLVGSSLGGFYATWLSEKYGIKAALVNPAVAPYARVHDGFLGRQVNYHTGEEYDFTLAYAQTLRDLTLSRIKAPENYLLLVQTGDEVLNYRQAVEFYAGCEQVVQTGGSHAFEGFEDALPVICNFAGLTTTDITKDE